MVRSLCVQFTYRSFSLFFFVFGFRFRCFHLFGVWASFNKQLLDEVEHDIMNYQNRGLCYLPKPKAEADNTDTRF